MVSKYAFGAFSTFAKNRHFLQRITFHPKNQTRRVTRALPDHQEFSRSRETKLEKKEIFINSYNKLYYFISCAYPFLDFAWFSLEASVFI